MSELNLDELGEDWAALKHLPAQTGLPRTVWIIENQRYARDVRAKVSTLRSGRGGWPDAASVSVHPICAEIIPTGCQPKLPAGDLALVCRWVALNWDVILDFWDGAITL